MTADDHVTRHLRLVGDHARVSPLAGHPGAYTVRRPGVTGPEAIIGRDRTGTYIMYAFDQYAPDPAGQWRATAHLHRLVDDAAAAQLAVELVAARELGVPGWHELLAAAMREGELAVSVARLHRPLVHADGPARFVSCAGQAGTIPSWAQCPTVRVLAGALGVTLAPVAGD